MNDAMIAFAKQFLSTDILIDDVKAQPPTQADLIQQASALKRAALNPDTNDYDALTELAAHELRQNHRLPDWLAKFAADVLDGKRKRPTKRGRDKYSNWTRNYKRYRAVQEVAHKFDLPAYSNNELSDKTTAADIVSQAEGCTTAMVITAYKRFTAAG